MADRLHGAGAETFKKALVVVGELEDDRDRRTGVDQHKAAGNPAAKDVGHGDWLPGAEDFLRRVPISGDVRGSMWRGMRRRTSL